MSMKIILVGYMGSGKSTIGKMLSKNIRIPFYDLDEVIEKHEEMSIKNIFEKRGEIYFRKVESLLFQEFINKNDDFILALGGGTPCYANNHEVLKRDEQVFETTRQNINEVFNTDKKQKFQADTKAGAIGNEYMVWFQKFYPKLKLAAAKFTQKIQSSTQDLMVKRLIPFNINESKVTFLFKIDKESNLGTKDAVIVAEIDGKIFHFDLQSYMALKKLTGDKNA